MFTDSHAHFSHILDRGYDLAQLLVDLTHKNFKFIMDIGTKPGDLTKRLNRITEALSKNNQIFPDWLYFSCGLWPDAHVIRERENAITLLEKDLTLMLDPHLAGFETKLSIPESRATYLALGECGLDRYWNGPNAQKSFASSAAKAPTQQAGLGFDCDDGPGTLDIAGEEALFEMQLDLAQKYNLPVIVHSREAFEATLACIKNMQAHRGVIHCFGYGLAEARSFLDEGWYISFPGTVTWAKKEAEKERIAELVRFIPKDRLLLETDAPYLTPNPLRGQVNTPLYIEHTYARVAEIVSLGLQELALLVEQNARDLFVRV